MVQPMIAVGVAIFSGLIGSCLVAAVTTYSQKKTQAFYYGQLTQKVDGNSQDISELREGFLDHEKRISHIEGSRAKGYGAH